MKFGSYAHVVHKVKDAAISWWHLNSIWGKIQTRQKQLLPIH